MELTELKQLVGNYKLHPGEVGLDVILGKLVEKIEELEKLKGGVLSDAGILYALQSGQIIIDPFESLNVNTSSYDVTLGKYYFREQAPSPIMPMRYYNIYNEKSVRRVWGNYCTAEPFFTPDRPWTIEDEGINEGDEVIWIAPGETILCHTEEFIGGVDDTTSMMKARSSFGRNFIEVCKCAGFGDVKYFNRWTMEVTNNSRYYDIPLVVGRRISQIVFLLTTAVLGDYSKFGNYQATTNLIELKNNWHPNMMRPRLHTDRAIKRAA